MTRVKMLFLSVSSALLATSSTLCLAQAGMPNPPAGSQPTRGESLVVTKDQVYRLAPGAHRFGRLQIEDGGRIELTGSTTILVGKMLTGKNAKIEYVKGSSPAEKVITLQAIDASGLSDLTIVGNGQAAADYPAGERARDGAAGQTARSEFVSGKWYEVPYWKNEQSTSGEAGLPGETGKRGEDAADVTMYLPGLRSGSKIAVETLGGRGGRGQDGGHGGQGGGSSKFHTASRGGPGGAGGNGGIGGNAGKIVVFLVVAPNEVSNKDEMIKAVNFRPIYAAGVGGAPGNPGGGGTKGDSGSHFCVGAGCGSSDGSAGPTGQPGVAGAGPTQGDANSQWANIDVMDLATYQQYVAQVWNQLGTTSGN